MQRVARLPHRNVAYIPSRLSAVQNAPNQFDHRCLLSSFIEFWTKTLRAPALRQAALIVFTSGIIVAAGAISAGAPGVMKPVRKSIMR